MGVPGFFAWLLKQDKQNKILKLENYKMDYEYRYWDVNGKLVHDLKYKKGVLINK